MAQLFLAVPITATPELAAVAARLARIGPPVKAVAADTLHVTVAFLGEVDEAAVGALGAAMRQAVAQVQPHPMILHGLGAFPSTRRPAIVWCGIANGQWLVELEARLRPRLEALHLPVDPRPLHPHATLARVHLRHRRRSLPPGLVEWLDAHRDSPFGRSTPDAPCLVHSTLTPEGPIHTVVDRTPLAGGRGSCGEPSRSSCVQPRVRSASAASAAGKGNPDA